MSPALRELCKHLLARALIDLPCSFVLSRFEIEEISRRVALPAAGKCSPSRRPLLISMSLPGMTSSSASTTCANARGEGSLRVLCSSKCSKGRVLEVKISAPQRRQGNTSPSPPAGSRARIPAAEVVVMSLSEVESCTPNVRGESKASLAEGAAQLRRANSCSCTGGKRVTPARANYYPFYLIQLGSCPASDSSPRPCV